jgi:hypothetical protein
MQNEKTQKELLLVAKALHGEPEELLSYLSPHLDEIAASYATLETVKNMNLDAKALRPYTEKLFPNAIVSYSDRVQRYHDGTEEELPDFLPYYIWYARQGVVEFLHDMLEK